MLTLRAIESVPKGSNAFAGRAIAVRLALTDQGFEVGFHGEHGEIVPNERLVYTEVYEGVPEEEQGEGVLNTVTFVESDGRTTLTNLCECGTREVRDTIIESGMEGGTQDAMDLLEEVAIPLG
jgi:uncharacterized protein YndB with AHSA1/START domain